MDIEQALEILKSSKVDLGEEANDALDLMCDFVHDTLQREKREYAACEEYTRRKEDFDDVILWHGAFSYYCGRATIAVSAFISDLIKNWPRLSKKARSLIERDLERAFLEDDDLRANGASYKRLGHDCDRQEWGKVRRLWTDKI